MTQTAARPGRPSGAATARRTVTLTGVQPTGELHLGNYVGAIRPLADLAAGRDPDQGVNMGLYGYPVLMAADILALDAHEVPVGADQAQHLEIAVDLARQFSRSYRPEVLREPRGLIPERTATLPGLDGRKMSKSYGNTIPLMAEPRAMSRQIRRIVTDSASPEQPKDPDASTLVALLRAFGDPGTVAAVEERYRTGGIGYGDVKSLLAGVIDAHVAPIRTRYRRLLTDPVELDARLAAGERQACERADRTLARTMEAMGV